MLFYGFETGINKISNYFIIIYFKVFLNRFRRWKFIRVKLLMILYLLDNFILKSFYKK